MSQKELEAKSILTDFPNKTENDYLYILPVERLSIAHKEKIGNLAIYPKGTANIDDLLVNHFFFDDKSIEINSLKENTLIVFQSVSPVKFSAQVTNNPILLNYAIDYATPVLDFIVFNYCNIKRSSCIPGRIGQIKTGETILLMFHEIGSPLTRIISDKIHTNTISFGNGLIIKESCILNSFPLLNNDINEIGNVSRHALRMYTQIIESNSNTEKFIQIIRLFEFIASPDKYEKFQNVKAKIIAHIAKNVYQLHAISEEFKYYSSGENGDGLRTQIFHQGKKLEELINEKELTDFFGKLHRYLYACINDLLSNYNKGWQFIEQLRVEKRNFAENNKTEILSDNYSSTIVLIDGNFLSSSINRFQQMYSKKIPQKKLDEISLAKLCYEILLNTRKWEEGSIYGFLILYSGILKFPFIKESFNEMNGQAIKIDKTEFEFHTFRLNTYEDLYISANQIMNDLNQNRKILSDKRSIFENLVFCGDDKHYQDTLAEINEKGSMDITLIRNTHESEMSLNIKFFSVGHLIGKALGLKSSEL